MTIFAGIEYVGEAVVSVLGLDDSRYQDVLDNMTEEEMEHARQVHEEREREYAEYQRQLELNRPSIENPAVETSVIVEDDSHKTFATESDAVPLPIQSNTFLPSYSSKHNNTTNYSSLLQQEAPLVDEEMGVALVEVTLVDETNPKQ